MNAQRLSPAVRVHQGDDRAQLLAAIRDAEAALARIAYGDWLWGPGPGARTIARESLQRLRGSRRREP